MSIELKQGGDLNLFYEVPDLHEVMIGLGWETNFFEGIEYDLDAEVFMLNKEDKVPTDEHFIFYHNRRSRDRSVEHLGDNRTGGTVDEHGRKLDDEVIHVELERIAPEIHKIVFTVSIYKAKSRHQNFGMVQKAYIRITNVATQEEICRFDLSENSSRESAVIFGALVRDINEWHFEAIGEGFEGGLRPLAMHYGVDVEPERQEVSDFDDMYYG